MSRRSALVGSVALALFLSVAEIARADRAWLLWGARRAHEATTAAAAWWVLAAYPTRIECENRRGAVHRQRASDAVSFECLPDTVDPRGAKTRP